MTPAPTYRVDLAIFRGPLDLLLYLVKRHEVEISDIPIAVITEQYLGYIQVLQAIDVEAAGEFLVVASTLMEIKSRMLLPDDPTAKEAQAEEDPRAELVKQLLAYKQYREAADRLDALAAEQARYWQRQGIERPAMNRDLADQPIQQVELWDLVSAFERVLRATLTHTDRTIIDDDTPLQKHMENILALLASAPSNEAGEQRLLFETVFTPPRTRGRMVGLFLALLELIKWGRVLAEQAEPFGPIELILIPGAAAEPLSPQELGHYASEGTATPVQSDPATLPNDM